MNYNYKRLIETIALATTFLACSLTLIYAVLRNGHLASFANIWLLICAFISFCIFGFFAVALFKTKFNSVYDSIFESPFKRKSWSVLAAIFVFALWLAIAVTLLSGIAPLFNEVSEEWRLAIFIFVSVWQVYLMVVMLVFRVKTLNTRKRRK
jgi:hypothetical protein